MVSITEERKVQGIWVCVCIGYRENSIHVVRQRLKMEACEKSL